MFVLQITISGGPGNLVFQSGFNIIGQKPSEGTLYLANQEILEAHPRKTRVIDCWRDVSQCQRRWTTQLATRSLASEYSILVYGLSVSLEAISLMLSEWTPERNRLRLIINTM